MFTVTTCYEFHISQLILNIFPIIRQFLQWQVKIILFKKKTTKTLFVASYCNI